MNPLDAMAAISGELEDGDNMDRLFYYDLRGWLVEDLLWKKDKMGMSASIEARVPYLDQDVVEYALKIGGLDEDPRPAAEADIPQTV
ncbi:MAG: hypothetical protein KAJ37_00635, partial [Candidatus Krumholzibacteria bacterium]|nr:hypothetical protein [Candidatus Krumholzibacteria bacterium]